MKSIYLIGLFGISVALFSCQNNKTNTKNEVKAESDCYASKDSEYAKINTVGGYGAPITKDNAVTYVDFLKTYKAVAPQKTKITAKVNGVCEKKGCWMSIDNGSKDGMMVHFKDYAFFVPRDIAGKTVIMEGVIQPDTTTVAELRHYAEDAGKTKEEIAKITEPKIELTFLADGVLINK
ncbi:MAG: DUF4920 domain-containing protein [Bacteroidota bacterium]